MIEQTLKNTTDASPVFYRRVCPDYASVVELEPSQIPTRLALSKPRPSSHFSEGYWCPRFGDSHGTSQNEEVDEIPRLAKQRERRDGRELSPISSKQQFYMYLRGITALWFIGTSTTRNESKHEEVPRHRNALFQSRIPWPPNCQRFPSDPLGSCRPLRGRNGCGPNNELRLVLLGRHY